jgi:hypothetical protein
MNPRILIAALAICFGLTAQLFADEPAQTSDNETTSPPAGRFTFVVAPNWPGQVEAGQFLAGFAYGNQLGIEVAPVEPPLRAHLQLKEDQGVVVTGATAGAGEPAKVGLAPHDVVLEIDGEQITGPEKFHKLVGGRQGKKAVLRVLRKGEPSQLARRPSINSPTSISRITWALPRTNTVSA